MRTRCKECDPCLAQDCGECVNCLDKPKFGGPNKKKQTCVKRKCVQLTSSKASLPATIKRRCVDLTKSKSSIPIAKKGECVDLPSRKLSILAAKKEPNRKSAKKPKIITTEKTEKKTIKTKATKKKTIKKKSAKPPKPITLKQIEYFSKFANKIVKARAKKKVESFKKDPEAEVTSIEFPFKDYPVIATDAFKKIFREFEKFESFFLPLIHSANPKLPLFALKYLCKVKYRDIFSP